MNNKNINAVIDLGSNKLKSAIYNLDSDPKLIAYAEANSFGINNSLITNFDEACKSITEIILDLEKNSEINIDKITVMLEPTEIITTQLTKFKKMEGLKIEKEDINFLLRESKKQLELNDESLTQIHMLNFKYLIDKKIYKEVPTNVFCDEFSLENIFVSVPKNILKNLNEVFSFCNLEINKFICPTYASGLYLLNKNQLENGCGLIDIGYEKTSIALFKNSSLIKLVVFPIGSNHITKDISKVCYLNILEAENIKVDKDLINQFIQNINEGFFLPNKYFNNSNYRKIPLKLIYDVMSSRISEILEMIDNNIQNFEGSEIIKNNLFAIGGGSKIIDLAKILKLNIKKQLVQIDTISNQEDSKFISCNSGQKLFINGWPSEAVAVYLEPQKKGIFTRFFEFFN